jgi:hypothetical protein
MEDTEDRKIIREPHPEVVRWLEYEMPWPADKPFPLTPLEAWYVMQGYTVKPAASITLEEFLQLPGKIEGSDQGLCLWQC